MAFTENLADFVATADFAVTVIYNGTPVALILDREYLETDLGEVSFSAAVVTGLLVTSDVPNTAQGDTVVIGAITYKVATPMVDPPDAGQGFTRIRLEKQ